MNIKTIAIIGGGIAGITCARTLANAGHSVHVFEKSRGFGGRMSTRRTPFGSFDHGAQYFTVRDHRFQAAIATTPKAVKIWSDVSESFRASSRPVEHRYVATPGMNALVSAWAAPLASDLSGFHQVHMNTLVQSIEPDVIQKGRWQIRTNGEDDSHHVHGGFDAVVLAVPHHQAAALLEASKQAGLAKPLGAVKVAPCWAMMLAFPQAAEGRRPPIGPSWNARRVDHPRIVWLARESSKPGREAIERWTVHASIAWSQEHLEDDEERVQAKLIRAFGEVTGIRAEPTYAQVHRWRYAQTTKPLGRSHIWDAKKGIGVCGDWCLGHRIEDGFVSGLEMALAIA
jgi:renalase